MKGKNHGVQKKLLNINPRAYHTSCTSHNLNLTLCDVANICGKARDLFVIIQRIYTIFDNSTKRRQVFKNNWNDRQSSHGQPHIRQVLDIKEDLLLVAEIGNDTKQISETRFLAQNELCNFWVSSPIVINVVSEHLQ